MAARNGGGRGGGAGGGGVRAAGGVARVAAAGRSPLPRGSARAAPGVARAEDLGPEYPVVPHSDLVSDWERVFYQALHRAGLRPVSQYEEAPYSLDFALFSGERKLDIEVDGEYYHRNWDGELCRRDQIRSQRLSDLGWDIMRFWVYEIRDDLAGSVRRAQAWLVAGVCG